MRVDDECVYEIFERVQCGRDGVILHSCLLLHLKDIFVLSNCLDASEK